VSFFFGECLHLREVSVLTCTYPKVLKTYSDSCRSATKIQSAVNKTVVLTRDAARMEKLPRKSHVIIIIKVVDLEGEHD
jgi:hypothetical protein